MSGYDGCAVDTFDFHHSMLAHEVRTSCFLRAIMETVKAGDVVVDIGAGTGVLSLFGVMAGASRVYSIEREPIIEVARKIASQWIGRIDHLPRRFIARHRSSGDSLGAPAVGASARGFR